jgi:DNA-binding MarR family transcriptional regulator
MKKKGNIAAREDDLGLLLEAFVNRVSHPRGRALSYMSEASVTVAQVILMSHAVGGGTSTSLAAAMNLSLSSISQMIERLVKLGFLRRSEDAEDRRRKTIHATPKAKVFLDELRGLRTEEFAAATAVLSRETRDVLKAAIARALRELKIPPPSSNEASNDRPARKARPIADAQR